MKNDLNNIDDLFKSALGSYTEAPPPVVWDALEKRLDGENKKRPGFAFSWFWVVLSVCCVVLMAGVYGWMMYGNKAGLAATADNNIITPAQVQQPAGKKADAAGSEGKTNETTKQNDTQIATHKIKAKKISREINTANEQQIKETAPAKTTEESKETPAGSKADDETGKLNAVAAERMIPVAQPAPAVVTHTVTSHSRHNIKVADEEVIEVVSAPISTAPNTNDKKTDQPGPVQGSKVIASANKQEDAISGVAARKQSKIDDATNTYKPVMTTAKKSNSSKEKDTLMSGGHIVLNDKIAGKSSVKHSLKSNRENESPAKHERIVAEHNRETASSSAGVKQLKKPAINESARDKKIVNAQVPVAATQLKATAEHKNKVDKKDVVAAQVSKQTDKNITAHVTKRKIIKQDKAIAVVHDEPAKPAVTEKDNNNTDKTLVIKKAPIKKDIVVKRNKVLASRVKPDSTATAKKPSNRKAVKKPEAALGIAAVKEPKKSQGITKHKAIETVEKDHALAPSVSRPVKEKKAIVKKEKKSRIKISNPVPIAKASVTKKVQPTKAIAVKPAINKQSKSSKSLVAAVVPTPAIIPAAKPDVVAKTEPVLNAAKPEIKTPAAAKKDTGTVATPKTDSNATAAVNDSNKKPSFWSKHKLEAGVKAGYEGGMGSNEGRKIVASPFIERRLNDRFSIMLQPSIKFASIDPRQLSGTQSYYRANADSLKNLIDSVPAYIPIPGGFDTLMIRNYSYSRSHDSLIKSYGLKQRYLELELPVLLKYRIYKGLSVYGGVNIIYSKPIGIAENTTSIKVMQTAAYSSGAQASAPAPALPAIDNVIHIPGTSINNYTGPLYPSPSGGLLRFGYMLGFSYEFNKRWLADVLVQQASVKSNTEGGININQALSGAYYRFTIGYKLKK